MEQLSVSTGSDLINDSGFKIEEDSSWDVFAGTSFREESVKGIITATYSFIRWHLSIGLNSVFETEQLPASITDLDTSLTNVYGNNLSHDLIWIWVNNIESYTISEFKIERSPNISNPVFKLKMEQKLVSLTKKYIFQWKSNIFDVVRAYRVRENLCIDRRQYGRWFCR